MNRFVQDDAFISFRYAHNLLTTGELTWNPAEEDPLEGYSNFLWVMMVAGAMSLGISPVAASQAFGLMFAFGTLFLTYRLSRNVFEAEQPALLAVALLGTNYTFSAYATGGLATQMQTCLILAGTYLAVSIHPRPDSSVRAACLLSVAAGVALLTRLDSGLPFGLLFCFVLWSARPLGRKTLPLLFALALPVSLLVIPWLGWKLYYYNDILPNPYYAKAIQFGPEIFVRGLRYLHEFLLTYFLWPVLLIGVVVFKRLKAPTVMRLLAVMVIAWCLYLTKIGGGFMEFRLLVPVLPLVFILIVAMIFSFKDARWGIALVVVVLAGSTYHLATYREVNEIAPVFRLKQAARAWTEIGESLKSHFHGASPPVKIATTAAGAIPYYAELPALDMHGLNDRFVATHGKLWRTMPGHWRLAPHRYLVEAGVNLVVGHPLIQEQADNDLPVVLKRGLVGFRILAIEPHLTPGPIPVIELPFGDQYKVHVLYLKPHPKIDAVIETAGLKVHYLPVSVEE